jgi:hypothetical protein
VIGPVLEFSDLQRISGYDRRADVERWDESNGIPVKGCRGGVWTTLAALHRALGLPAANEDGGEYPPELI